MIHSQIGPRGDWEDAMDYALIGPRDSRTQVAATTRFPYNTICYLGRDYGSGRFSGCTGTLIGPRLVLTAGHCLFSHRRRRAPLRIRVMPGRADRDTRPYGHIDSQEYYAHRRYLGLRGPRDPARRWYDYGIIVLPESFPRLRRHLRTPPLSRRALNRIKQMGQIEIAGYPGDRPIGTLWRHVEYLKHFTPRRLLYTVDTCPGHSGSPIWFHGKGLKGHHLIGIHTTGIVDERGRSYGCSRGTVLAPPGAMNSGVRLTPAVFANIWDPKRRSIQAGPMIRLN